MIVPNHWKNEGYLLPSLNYKPSERRWREVSNPSQSKKPPRFSPFLVSATLQTDPSHIYVSMLTRTDWLTTLFVCINIGSCEPQICINEVRFLGLIYPLRRYGYLLFAVFCKLIASVLTLLGLYKVTTHAWWEKTFQEREIPWSPKVCAITDYGRKIKSSHQVSRHNTCRSSKFDLEEI